MDTKTKKKVLKLYNRINTLEAEMVDSIGKKNSAEQEISISEYMTKIINAKEELRKLLK